MRRFLARLMLLALAATVAIFGFLNFQLYREICRPPRVVKQAISDVLMEREDVSFSSSDGVNLAGVFLRGKAGAPAIAFVHDRKAERSQVLAVALLLNHLGYGVLAFDLRAHGQSGGSASSLGILEAKDVEGAVAYLDSRADVKKGSVGVWGIGMGAYATVLAAGKADALPTVRAVALNFLYPDARAIMAQEFENTFHTPMGALGTTYDGLFTKVTGATFGSGRLEDHVDGLKTRQVLFVVSEDDAQSKNFVTDKLYQAVDPYHRTLLNLHRRGIPTEGSDRESFELNTMQFFKTTLPLPGSGKS
ncbi:MAG: hypothetical protein U0166_14840 [Acidobacteriota bacterium]